MRLYTSNPKADTANLLKNNRKERREIESARVDRSPLRQYYIASKDAVIYSLVRNYLVACDVTFWKNARSSSFITRTVGVQALLDILRRLARDAVDSGDISVDAFVSKLKDARDIDFAKDEYQNASGAGRSYIRRVLEDALGLSPLGRPRAG